MEWYDTDSEASPSSHIWSASTIFLESMGATEAQLMMVIIILPQIPLWKTRLLVLHLLFPLALKNPTLPES